MDNRIFTIPLDMDKPVDEAAKEAVQAIVEITDRLVAEMKIEEINDETEVLTITWKIADLKEAFESKELEFNELNLNHALSYVNLRKLEEQSIERGWEVIYDFVEELKMARVRRSLTPNEMSFAVGCGSKKYVTYEEGMKLYSLGKTNFTELAKNANAIRKVKGRNLVHIPTLEEYIETMCVE